MPIPPFEADGRLPAGVHDASLAEVRERFGRFQGNDRRVRLQAALQAFVAEARASGLVDSLIIDGSFTSAEEKPGDVDVILVLRPDVDLSLELRPDQYNVVSPGRIRSRYPLDVRITPANSADVEEAVGFLARVRGQPTVRKGMVTVTL